MKIILTLLLSATGFASETFVGENIMINGLRVSARKHWNFQRSATPDVLFCKHHGFPGALKNQTVTKRVEPQRMTFFTAEFISDGVLSVRENETTLLEEVTCR